MSHKTVYKPMPVSDVDIKWVVATSDETVRLSKVINIDNGKKGRKLIEVWAEPFLRANSEYHIQKVIEAFPEVRFGWVNTNEDCYSSKDEYVRVPVYAYLELLTQCKKWRVTGKAEDEPKCYLDEVSKAVFKVTRHEGEFKIYSEIVDAVANGDSTKMLLKIRRNEEKVVDEIVAYSEVNPTCYGYLELYLFNEDGTVRPTDLDLRPWKLVELATTTDYGFWPVPEESLEPAKEEVLPTPRPRVDVKEVREEERKEPGARKPISSFEVDIGDRQPYHLPAEIPPEISSEELRLQLDDWVLVADTGFSGVDWTMFITDKSTDLSLIHSVQKNLGECFQRLDKTVFLDPRLAKEKTLPKLNEVVSLIEKKVRTLVVRAQIGNSCVIEVTPKYGTKTLIEIYPRQTKTMQFVWDLLAEKLPLMLAEQESVAASMSAGEGEGESSEGGLVPFPDKWKLKIQKSASGSDWVCTVGGETFGDILFAYKSEAVQVLFARLRQWFAVTLYDHNVSTEWVAELAKRFESPEPSIVGVSLHVTPTKVSFTLNVSDGRYGVSDFDLPNFNEDGEKALWHWLKVTISSIPPIEPLA